MVLFLFTIIPCAADSDNSGSSDSSKIELPPTKPKDPKLRPNRMPGAPIYGEYAAPVLVLYVDEEVNYQLVVAKDGVEVECVTLSGSELNAGYAVSVSAPFSIELTAESGATYAGEVL